MHNIWFTSDTHFRHKPILQYMTRPWPTIEEHDEGLISLWNQYIKPGDVVYHLGDFSFSKTQEDVEYLLGRLHGCKHLILGNHDWDCTRKASGWQQVTPYKEIKVGTQKVCLFHYRMVVWNKMHHGSWALHGHSHGSLPKNYNARTFDVGVDCWNFTPIHYDVVAKEMTLYGFKHVDYHGDPGRKYVPDPDDSPVDLHRAAKQGWVMAEPALGETCQPPDIAPPPVKTDSMERPNLADPEL